MLKWCVDKWFQNKENLRQVLDADKELKDCSYSDLVKLVVEHILNVGESELEQFDADAITTVNNGEHEGTLLFLIPRKVYQPNAGCYLLTYVEYGSCEWSDAIQRIWDAFFEEKIDKNQVVDDFMKLCKDIVCNITKPYNVGRFENEKFITVIEQEQEKKQTRQEKNCEAFQDLLTMIMEPCLINLDAESVQTLMKERKQLFIGIGRGKDVLEAINHLFQDWEMQEAFRSAERFIVLCSGEYSLLEAYDAINYLYKYLDEESPANGNLAAFNNIGVRYEEKEEMKITVFAVK